MGSSSYALMRGSSVAIGVSVSLFRCLLWLPGNAEQIITRGNLAGFARDRAELGGVSDHNRSNQVIALGTDEVWVKANQLIARGNTLLLFHMNFEAFAAQFHGIEAYVDEQLHAIVEA